MLLMLIDQLDFQKVDISIFSHNKGTIPVFKNILTLIFMDTSVLPAM